MWSYLRSILYIIYYTACSGSIYGRQSVGEKCAMSYSYLHLPWEHTEPIMMASTISITAIKILMRIIFFYKQNEAKNRNNTNTTEVQHINRSECNNE